MRKLYRVRVARGDYYVALAVDGIWITYRAFRTRKDANRHAANLSSATATRVRYCG